MGWAFSARLSLKWTAYSLRFRQNFTDGFRYLDRCGQFMLAAIEELDVMPGDVKPTNAQLAIPEDGIRAGVDVTMLEVTQELPVDEDVFLTVSTALARLAQTHFGPLRIEKQLFEVKYFVPMNTEADAARFSLRLPTGDQTKEQERDFDMTAESCRVDDTFVSGAQRLEVKVHPAAFETVRIHRHNPTLGASASQVTRAKRLTALADRVPAYSPCAVFLEVLLAEEEPPKDSAEHLLKTLLQKAEVAKKLYLPSP